MLIEKKGMSFLTWDHFMVLQEGLCTVMVTVSVSTHTKSKGHCGCLSFLVVSHSGCLSLPRACVLASDVKALEHNKHDIRTDFV